jgi:hypothetical protein
LDGVKRLHDWKLKPCGYEFLGSRSYQIECVHEFLVKRVIRPLVKTTKVRVKIERVITIYEVRFTTLLRTSNLILVGLPLEIWVEEQKGS